MSAYIQELKREHEQLLAVLLEAQKLGLATEQGRGKLMECKSLLSGHLRKEDTKLYPVLSKLSAGDSAALKMVKDFSSEMNGLSRSIIDFINKAANSDINMEYAKELGRIISGIRMRIRKEEMQLYPLYEKLNAG